MRLVVTSRDHNNLEWYDQGHLDSTGPWAKPADQVETGVRKPTPRWLDGGEGLREAPA